MQCQRLISRRTCRSHNAYNAASALARAVLPSLSREAARHISTTPTDLAQESLEDGQRERPESELRIHRVSSDGWGAVRTAPGFNNSRQKKTQERHPIGLGQDDPVSQVAKHERDGTNERPSFKRLSLKKLHHRHPIKRAPLEKKEEEAIVSLLGEDLFNVIKSYWAETSINSNVADSWKLQMRVIAAVCLKLPRETRLDTLPPSLVDLIEYNGKPIEPPSADYITYQSATWLAGEAQSDGLDSRTALDQDIARFCAYAQLTPAEQESRRLVVQEMQEIVSRALPDDNYHTEIFGSGRLGLAMSNSDIDLRLFPSAGTDQTGRHLEWGHEERNSLLTAMNLVRGKLADSPIFRVSTFRKNKFPIINAVHQETGILVQLIASPSTDGQAKEAARYLQEIPQLRCIHAIMHTMLNLRGLGDVFYGGIGSYGLLILLAAILRHDKKGRLRTNTDETCGALLVECMDFIVSSPGFQHVVLSPELPTRFQKHILTADETQHKIEGCLEKGDMVQAGLWKLGRKRQLQPYMMCLQDPADPMNDLGFASNAIKHVRSSVKWALNNLQARMKAIDEGKVPMEGHPRLSMLALLVGPAQQTWAERRRRAEEYGQKTAKDDNDLRLFRS